MTDAGTPVPANQTDAVSSSLELTASAVSAAYREIIEPAANIAMGIALPAHYTPKIAAYARGPFLTPDLVTPSEWKWRNARTFTVRCNGHDYRAIRVSSAGKFIGYWAVELLGVPFDMPGGADDVEPV